MAATMVYAGYTAKDALEYIGSRRTIYGGHFMNHGSWPKGERDGKHAKDFCEAHEFLKSIEVGCGVKAGSEPSACVEQWVLPSVACSQMAPEESESPKDALPSFEECTDDPSNPQTEQSESPKDGLQPVKQDGLQPVKQDPDAPSDAPPVKQDGLQPTKSESNAPPVEDDAPVENDAWRLLQTAPDADGDRADGDSADGDRADGLPPVTEFDVDYGRQSDEEDKSSVWTDEDEHVLWKAMTLPQRFKHVNSMRRKLAWHVEAQTASLQDGLQPEAQNDQLPADMLCFLQECNLMKLSHPQRKEIGKRCVGNSGESACN